jgi:hypothetical protein
MFVKIYFAVRDVLGVSDWRETYRDITARKDLSRRVVVCAGLCVRITVESVYERVICHLREIVERRDGWQGFLIQSIGHSSNS